MKTKTESKITLIVKDVINSEFAVSAEKGKKLKDKVLEEFETYEKIELDFVDIKATITAFLNEAYGGLFYKRKKNEIKEKIEFKNVSKTTEKLIETVNDLIDNYYFKDDE